MATLDELLVRIDASTELLRRELTKGDTSVKGFVTRTDRRLAGLEKRFATVGKSVRGVFSGFGVGGFIGGLGLVAGIRSAANAARDFEKTLSEIVGLVGVSEREVQGFTGAINDIARATGRGPQELAEAMFFVTSAGKRGQEAIDVLTVSAQAAAAGLGETKVIADAVTGAINAYGAEALSASRATDILVSTVREGKAAADSITGSIGRVIPVAAQMGVTFDQVGATIAALTRINVSADESGTALRAMLLGLLDPGEKAKKQLADLHTSAEQLRAIIRERGLLAALFDLRDRFGDNETAIANVFENSRALIGVLGLIGKNAEEVKKVFKSVETSTDSLKDSFAAASDTADFKLNQALAAIQVTSIELGNVVLPHLAVAFDKLAEAMTTTVGAAKDFGEGLARAIHGADEPLQRIKDEIAELEALLAQPNFFGRFNFKELGFDTSQELQARLDFLKEILRTEEQFVENAKRAAATVAAETSVSSGPAADSKTAKKATPVDTRLGFVSTEGIVERAAEAAARTAQTRATVQGVRDALLEVEETSKETSNRINENWESLGESMQFSIRSSLADAFLGVEQSFSDTLRRMVADLAASKLLDFIGGSFGEGPVGSFFKGLSGRAHGGPVSGGKPYMVGERGPELFVPNVSGQILASAKGMGGVNVQVINQGAQVSKPQVSRGSDGGISVRMVVRGMMGEELASGSFDTILGSRFGLRPSLGRR